VGASQPVSPQENTAAYWTFALFLELTGFVDAVPPWQEDRRLFPKSRLSRASASDGSASPHLVRMSSLTDFTPATSRATWTALSMFA